MLKIATAAVLSQKSLVVTHDDLVYNGFFVCHDHVLIKRDRLSAYLNRADEILPILLAPIKGGDQVMVAAGHWFPDIDEAKKSKIGDEFIIALKDGNSRIADGSMISASRISSMTCHVRTRPSSRIGVKEWEAKGYYVQEDRAGDLYFVIVGDKGAAQGRKTQRIKLDQGEIEWIKINGKKVYY